MTIEITVWIIGIAFILLTSFFIVTLIKMRKVIKKADRILTEAHHLLHTISEPTAELIDNANKLLIDVRKKSEGLDVLFHPLYELKKEKAEKHNTSEKICNILEYAMEGIQLFNKIKKGLK